MDKNELIHAWLHPEECWHSWEQMSDERGFIISAFQCSVCGLQIIPPPVRFVNGGWPPKNPSYTTIHSPKGGEVWRKVKTIYAEMHYDFAHRVWLEALSEVDGYDEWFWENILPSDNQKGRCLVADYIRYCYANGLHREWFEQKCGYCDGKGNYLYNGCTGEIDDDGQPIIHDELIGVITVCLDCHGTGKIETRLGKLIGGE